MLEETGRIELPRPDGGITGFKPDKHASLASLQWVVAEAGGIEPPRPFRTSRFSKPISTPTLRASMLVRTAGTGPAASWVEARRSAN